MNGGGARGRRGGGGGGSSGPPVSALPTAAIPLRILVTAREKIN